MASYFTSRPLISSFAVKDASMMRDRNGIDEQRQGRMGNSKKQERTAIEAVARRFSATWEEGRDPGRGYLVIAGKRIAVEMATLNPRGGGHGSAATPRLRFDKVVIRLFERLQAALGEIVPDGMTVLLTVTAPIRLASKTAAVLEDKIRTRAGRGSPDRDESATIHGNRVRIRFLRHESTRAPKMIGFVHNADSDPLLLLNMTSELHERIGGADGRPTTRPAGNRWLVLMSAGEPSRLEVYRYIYSQLRVATGFREIVMVFDDGRVGTLTGGKDSARGRDESH
jgi:hypothetical protein